MEIKKSDKANLENKKLLFVEIGLVVALGITLFAFEWTSKETTVSVLEDTTEILIEEEIIPITQEAPPPPPAAPKIPVLSDQIDIVDDEIELEEDEFQEYVPNEDEIIAFIGKQKLHLSCNLMKDYIGTPEEVVRYLDWASKIGCLDIGFVSLMPANNYCKEQFVDFNDLKFEEVKDDDIKLEDSINNISKTVITTTRMYDHRTGNVMSNRYISTKEFIAIINKLRNLYWNVNINNPEHLYVLSVGHALSDIVKKPVTVAGSKFFIWRLNRKLGLKRKGFKIQQMNGRDATFGVQPGLLVNDMRAMAKEMCGPLFVFGDIYQAFYERKKK